MHTIVRQQTTYYIHRPYDFMYGIAKKDNALHTYEFDSTAFGMRKIIEPKRCLSKRSVNTVSAQLDLQERLRSVSLPGLDRVLDSRLEIWRRIFWALIILCLAIMCFYQLVQRLKIYIHQPISVHVDVEAAAELEFPAITICPVEPFLYSKDFNELRKQYAIQFQNTTFSPENMDELEGPESKTLDLLLLPGVTVNTLWEIAHLSNATHVRKGRVLCQLHSRKNCHLTMHVEEIVTYAGTCLTFSLDGNLIYDGTYNGIELELHNYENNIDWNFMAFLHEVGHMSKHDVYTQPQEFLYPQQETHITFNIKKIICANTRSNPCVGAAEAHECHRKCVEAFILANISCSLPYLNFPHLRLCTTPQGAKHTYFVTELVYEHERTLCSYCPRECQDIVYVMTQDVVKPTTQNETKIRLLMTNNYVEQITEHKAYSIGLLLGDIGGNLGFFMGMCLVSWLQLAEVVIVVFCQGLKTILSKIYSRISAPNYVKVCCTGLTHVQNDADEKVAQR